MNGIIKNYTFDTNYFEIGCAFELHNKYETNVYFNAILTDINDNTLVFITKSSDKYPSGSLTIELKDLIICSSWEIIKLTEDYKNGVFSSEE